jgi:hypothetical protein
MGKPVVSTPLETVLEFNREHGVLRIAGNEPGEFLGAGRLAGRMALSLI